MDAPYAPAWRPLARAGARAAEAAPVLLSRPCVEAGGARARAFVARLGRPVPFTDSGVEVTALRLGPQGMLDEHSADEDILLMAQDDGGRTRVGGDGGTWQALAPGEATLWPSGRLHALEAGPAGLEVRLVHLGRPR